MLCFERHHTVHSYIIRFVSRCAGSAAMSRERERLVDVCEKQKAASLRCLEENQEEKTVCKEHFEAYRECIKSNEFVRRSAAVCRFRRVRREWWVNFLSSIIYL
jgi:negative regulator of replication initiation